MNLIQIMPSSTMAKDINSYIKIKEICEIITNMTTDAKEAKKLQKVAGDIEALEKVCEILSQQNLADVNEDVEMSNSENQSYYQRL